jgi:hypothetical protein
MNESIGAKAQKLYDEHRVNTLAKEEVFSNLTQAYFDRYDAVKEYFDRPLINYDFIENQEALDKRDLPLDYKVHRYGQMDTALVLYVNNLRGAAEHFRANQEAYYDMAVTEATKDGIKLDLGHFAVEHMSQAA